MFTASAGQQAALPIRSTSENAVTSSAILINGASGSAAVQVNSDDAFLQVNPAGALSGDCTAVIFASPNNSNFAVVRTLTNAEITASYALGNGWAGVLKIGQGNWVKCQFIAGTTTGAGNGVVFRVRT
jgi:hypothetical protein